VGVLVCRSVCKWMGGDVCVQPDVRAGVSADINVGISFSSPSRRVSMLDIELLLGPCMCERTWEGVLLPRSCRSCRLTFHCSLAIVQHLNNLWSQKNSE